MVDAALAERRRKYKQQWNARNKERVYANAKKKQLEDPARHAAYKTAWAARNKEYERQRAELKNRKYFGLPDPTRARPELCECCGGKTKNKVLALDHCHATGAFRGWLCAKCNMGLGLLGDKIESVQKAIEYLKRCMQ